MSMSQKTKMLLALGTILLSGSVNAAYSDNNQDNAPSNQNASQDSYNSNPNNQNGPKLEVNFQKEGDTRSESGVMEYGTSNSQNSQAQAENEQIIHDVLDVIRNSRNYNVNVHVFDKVVTLDGTVDSKNGSRDIEDKVKKVNGVKKVVNNLQVKPGASR